MTIIMSHYQHRPNHTRDVVDLGKRLRIAMGEEEVLSRNHFHGGELRVPTYRAYAESLDFAPWTTLDLYGRTMYIQPYNEIYDGWSNNRSRSGLMAASCNAYEYAYKYWENIGREHFPDPFDDGTFGVWLGLLPQPANITIKSDPGLQVSLR